MRRVEGALQLWLDRGVLWNASADPERAGRYRLVSGNGTLWEGVT